MPVRHDYPMHAHLGDFPTWIASVGTVGALVAALWQIRNERQRRIAKETQTRRDERRSHARHVAAWVETSAADTSPIRARISLINSSLEPVYCVFVGAVYIQGAAPETIEKWLKLKSIGPAPVAMVSILPPGKWAVVVRHHPSSPMQGRLGAEVAFSDRSGVHWIRRVMGQLEELPANPIEYFSPLGLNPPYDWVTPEAGL